MHFTNAIALAVLSIGVVAAPQYPGQPTGGSGSYPGSGSGGGYPGQPGGGSGGSPYPGGGSGGSPYPGGGSYSSYYGGGSPAPPSTMTTKASMTSAKPAPQPASSKASGGGGASFPDQNTSGGATGAPPPATTTAPAAGGPPAAGGAPVDFSFTVITAAGTDAVGGIAQASGGPAAGSLYGTGAFITGVPQATGGVGGTLAGASGALMGGGNPSQLAGCAGGQDFGFGYTQCVTAPLMARATEAPRPSGAPGFFETFTYTTAASSNGANLVGGALGATGGALGGAASGTAIYQTGKPAATGNIGGAIDGNSGKLAGGASPAEIAGCAGGTLKMGPGFTQCITAPLAARATMM